MVRRWNFLQMSDYKQPDFYRFNSDSLILVQWIIDRGLFGKSILDLGAGCGVIGIELAIHLKPIQLTSLELQNDFLPYLKMNSELLVPGLNHRIFSCSFAEWKPDTKYDLIVSNPPYYLPDSGQPSSDVRRGIARTFSIDGWPSLLECIERSLSLEGKAFIVLKNEKKTLELIRRVLLKSELQLKEEVISDLVVLELVRLNVD